MLQQSPRVKTKCAALDQVLDGGLRRGHILEISGPPGSPKEKLIINVISVFAEAEEDILFVGKRTTWESSKIFCKPR
jgi:RAD51-like protein 2